MNSPLSEEDKKLIRELLDKVDALELAVVAVVQAQDEETKCRLSATLDATAEKHLLDPPPMDRLTYRYINDALERLFSLMRKALAGPEN